MTPSEDHEYGQVVEIHELWGPMRCQGIKKNGRECGRECLTMWLTRREFERLPVESGPEATTFIFRNNLGVALCEEHLPKE